MNNTIYLKKILREEIKKEIKRQKYINKGQLMTENGEIVEGFFSQLLSGLKGTTTVLPTTPVGKKITTAIQQIKQKTADIAKSTQESFTEIKKAYTDAKQLAAIDELTKDIQTTVNNSIKNIFNTFVPRLQKANLGVDILSGALNQAIQISLAAANVDAEKQLQTAQAAATQTVNTQPAE